MNCDQIFRLALFQTDQVKQSGTASSFAVNAELVSWVNDGNRRLEAVLRATRADYGTRIMNSETDTTAERIFGVSYTPSTSLRIAADTTSFTLPPDFQSMRVIRCVTDEYEDMLILPRDISSRDLQLALKGSNTTSASTGSTLFYDIIGDRTMRIAPAVDTAFDIEIVYVARTRPLVRYATGTIAVTDADTAVTGTSTVWLTNSPFDANYLDIMMGTSGSATLPVVDPTWDYDQINLAKVASITTNTALVLAANKSGTLAAGTGYILSSVPQAPPEYHFAIADYVTAKLLLKQGGSSTAKAPAFLASFSAILNDIKANASSRQSSEARFVEDDDPGEDY